MGSPAKESAFASTSEAAAPQELQLMPRRSNLSPPTPHVQPPVWAPETAAAAAAKGRAVPPVFLRAQMTPYPAPTNQERPLPQEEEERNESPASKAEGSQEKSGRVDRKSSASGKNSSSSYVDHDEWKGFLSSRKRRYKDIVTKGEALHLVTADQHNGVDIEASDVRGEHSVKMLSVSPESLMLRALPPGSETELNTEIDQCSYPSPLLGNDPVAHKQQRLQDDDEFRERRKQANRESARRSRIRKRQEYEDSARMMAVLKNENDVLKAKNEILMKRIKDLEAGSIRIMEILSGLYWPADTLDVLGIRPS
ncbi:unnamed protein product [Musa acuminata subsp. burmannicoides]